MIMWDYPTLPLDTNSSKVTALPTFPVTVADNTTRNPERKKTHNKAMI